MRTHTHTGEKGEKVIDAPFRYIKVCFLQLSKFYFLYFWPAFGLNAPLCGSQLKTFARPC